MSITPGPWEIEIEEDSDFDHVFSRYCVGIREVDGERRWIVRFDDDYGTDQWADAKHIVELHNSALETE